jgi:hypothetical protein
MNNLTEEQVEQEAEKTLGVIHNALISFEETTGRKIATVKVWKDTVGQWASQMD